MISRTTKVICNLLLIINCICSALHGAPITVTNNADIGSGSLRDALASAASGDTIVFAIGTGLQTITVATPLLVPVGVTIDGSTQPGTFPPDTKHIQISGNSTITDTLELSGNDTVTELAINGSSNNILFSGAGGNKVTNCYVSTTATGTVPSSISPHGITSTASSNNLIQGCLIAFNSNIGVLIQNGSSSNTLINNTIENNTNAGISIIENSSNNTIGQIGNGNTILNNGEGIVLRKVAALNPVGNIIQYNSNYNNGSLGTDFGGTGVPLPNSSTNPVANTPNESQNYPDVISAVSSCGSLTVNYNFYDATALLPESGLPKTLSIPFNFSKTPEMWQTLQKDKHTLVRQLLKLTVLVMFLPKLLCLLQ